MDIERKDLKRRNTRRRWLIGIAAGALALAAVAGVGLLGPALPLVDGNSVWIDTVKRGQMLREVRGQGVLSPKEIRWITAQTAAAVERIGIKPGAVVAADTVLMELGSPEATEELESARAALAAARADAVAKRMGLENQLLDEKSRVAQIRSAYALARAKVDATEGLANQGIIPALTSRLRRRRPRMWAWASASRSTRARRSSPVASSASIRPFSAAVSRSTSSFSGRCRPGRVLT